MAKSILLLMLKPIVWVVLLAAIGLISKNRKQKRVMLILAGLVFILFSNGFLANLAITHYEPDRLALNGKKYEVGIVLGGYSSYHPGTNTVRFFEASDRLWQAIRLYRSGVIKKILISGGNKDTVKNPRKEADIIFQYLADTGVDKHDIIVENKSTNTKENALFSLQKINELGLTGNILIITSNWHIPRSKIIFSRHRFPGKLDYYGADSLSVIQPNIETFFLPSANALRIWEILLKEIAGRLVA